MAGIRRILAAVRDAETGRAPLRAAFALSTALGARTVALHVRRPPVEALALERYGMAPPMIQQLGAEAARVEDRTAEAAHALFDEMRDAAGLVEDGPGDRPSAVFETATGLDADVLPRHARSADLVVLGGAGALGADSEAASVALDTLDTLYALVMHGGRPVLLVPDTVPEVIGRRVLVAWNGSAEAARALAGALPILEAAAHVSVVRAEEVEEAGDLEAPLAYLGGHGITPQSWVVTHGGDPAAAILREAEALEADLLVMGAYSHSRLREVVLGGFTHYALRHATLPLLLSR